MCLSQRRDEQKKEIPQSTAQHSTHSHKMAKLLLLVVVGIAALAAAQAQQLQQLQRLISEEQSKCASGQDSMACIKERAMRFVDNVLSKDSYTVSNSSSGRERESSAVIDDDANPFHPLLSIQLSNMEVHSNGQQVTPVSEARANSADGFLEAIENYMRGHDVSLNLPGADAKITVSARNLANDELSLNLQLNDASDASDIEARGKKGNIFKKGGLNAASESIKPPY